MPKRRLVAASTAAVAFAFAIPGIASASVSCAFTSGTLNVEVSEGSQAALSVSGQDIVVADDNTGAVSACTGSAATRTNTDSIFVTGSGQGGGLIVTKPSMFEPGPPAAGQDPSDSSGGTREIEIFDTLTNPGTQLTILAGQGEQIRFGTNGINPNAGSETGPADADITVGASTRVSANLGYVDGGGGTLDASGGAGTGLARSTPISLFLTRGSNRAVGGDGADTLSPTVTGSANEVIDGGPGIDTLESYGQGATGINIDLALTGPQQIREGAMATLSNLENLTGTRYSSNVLRGDPGPNVIVGGIEADVLEGRAGPDTLNGDEGSDTIEARDGQRDVVDCGAGTDSVVTDAPGADSLTGCENVSYPAIAVTSGTASQPAPAASSPAIVDRTRPLLTGLRFSPQSFRAASSGASASTRRTRAPVGAKVSFTLSERASVRFVVERRREGRRVGRRCKAATRANRRKRPCALYRAVKGSFTVPAKAGRNTFTFRGRVGGGQLKPGTYRLQSTAADLAKNSGRPVRTSFRIVR